jgi:hypothetical protein
MLSPPSAHGHRTAHYNRAVLSPSEPFRPADLSHLERSGPLHRHPKKVSTLAHGLCMAKTLFRRRARLIGFCAGGGADVGLTRITLQGLVLFQ